MIEMVFGLPEGIPMSSMTVSSPGSILRAVYKKREARRTFAARAQEGTAIRPIHQPFNISSAWRPLRR